MGCARYTYIGTGLAVLGFVLLLIDFDRVRAQVERRDPTPRRVLAWLSRLGQRVSGAVRRSLRRASKPQSVVVSPHGFEGTATLGGDLTLHTEVNRHGIPA